MTPHPRRPGPTAGERLRRGLAGLCAALTLLLALGALGPTGNSPATHVAASGAHDVVAAVAAQQPSRVGVVVPVRAGGASPGPSGAAAPPAAATPHVVQPQASHEAPVGRASRDRSPPVQP